MPKKSRFVAHRKTDSVYRWCYVANTNAKAARKSIQFASMRRRTHTQSDWVSAIWGSPIVTLAPPKGVTQCQTT